MPRAAVLYVEDEEDDIFFMRRAFAKAGCADAFHAVKDGKRAITYLSGENGECPSPQVILLDLNLPLVSGFEVLEWIRRQPHFQSLPVIIFSSSGRPEDRSRAEALGANDYLLKPASAEDFVSVASDIVRAYAI
jgi:CheY-like chemotaxis protein